MCLPCINSIWFAIISAKILVMIFNKKFATPMDLLYVILFAPYIVQIKKMTFILS